jgi:uncharacterized protein YaeQ
MALTATIYNFVINLSDVDRHVYETLQVKAAQHPSETDEFLVTRVLAYALEFTEGISFSRGIAEPDEPAVMVRDLTGALTVWIDIGAPDAARLHKASKMANRVAVYSHRDSRTILKAVEGQRIHRAKDLEIHLIDRDLIAALAARLDRRMTLGVSVTERHLYATVGDETFDGPIERLAIGD